MLLDVGANVDSRPEHLVQFAVMGEMYYRATFGNRKPRVGLLSIGEEESKGNELTREVNERLKGAHMQYIGNVEGGDLFSGDVDVIVVGVGSGGTLTGVGRCMRKASPKTGTLVQRAQS